MPMLDRAGPGARRALLYGYRGSALPPKRRHGRTDRNGEQVNISDEAVEAGAQAFYGTELIRKVTAQ